MAKDTNIIVRAKQEDKDTIKKASELKGLSMSNFIIESSINRAKRIINEMEKGK